MWRRHNVMSVGYEAPHGKLPKAGESPSAGAWSDDDVPVGPDLADAKRKGLAEVEAAAVRAMGKTKAKKAAAKGVARKGGAAKKSKTIKIWNGVGKLGKLDDKAPATQFTSYPTPHWPTTR